MDIEKLYEETQQKMNQNYDLEENNFLTQILSQDNAYYSTLKDVIQFYPTYKVEDTATSTTEYTTKLSKLNGISENIKTITASIKDKIEIFDSSLKKSGREIENLKKIEHNLENYNGDFDNLDLTSQRLLKDYVNIYTTNRIMVFIKTVVIFYLLYKLIAAAVIFVEIRKYIFMWCVCLGLLFILNYLMYQWQTNVAMPASMVSNGVINSNNPLSCSNTEFGCCPDGITASSKDKTNCGCAESTYGCCADGTDKNEDGSCTFSKIDPIPCNESEFGCCKDGITHSNEDGSNCTAAKFHSPLCARSQYGCCPDGNTKSNADRSNCIGSCTEGDYGCCPDGVTISNRFRSNCNLPDCASSAYGCCPNGKPRNKIGSNC